MTHRERFNRTLHFQPVDHVPDEEFGYWTDTLTTWHQQGLPKWVDDNAKADLFFGFAPRKQVPVRVGVYPGFIEQILEETDQYRIIVDNIGVKCIVHKNGASSIPHYLSFPIQNRTNWEDFRLRLDPNTPGRIPDFKLHLSQWQLRDYPLGISVGSLFGWIRNWAGFEGASLLVYDDPVLFEEIMEQITQVIVQTITPVLETVDLDFAAGWEDMCFNHGPIISPGTFEKYMVPRYKRITSLLSQHGVDRVIVDCDGDISQLVSLWLESGVNCMFPLEIAAGTNPFKLHDLYGQRVLLLGGVNKIPLIQGKETIKREIKRIEPLVREGGYIPHVDHRVPPDVTYQNYLYYLQVKRDTFGIPTPLPWAERAEALVAMRAT